VSGIVIAVPCRILGASSRPETSGAGRPLNENGDEP
jgi:hypothetical protein